jgi:hypothetical protein
LNEKVAAPVYQTQIIGSEDSLCSPRDTVLSAKVSSNIAEERRSQGRYASVAD